MYHPGWAITISLEPTFEVRDRCGLSTSTRKMIQRIWPVKLPKMDPEMLARLVFCFENNPERHDGIIPGAQDSIGICVPGLVRHYYDNNFWPEKIESTQDEMTLRFLEDHLVMIPMEPRRPGCRINLSQSLNGIGWIVGPLVGGQLLFTGVNIAIPYALVGIFVLAVALVLLVCVILTFVATLIVVVCCGTLSLIAFFALYLGESIMFPTIFSLALRDAGTKTKLASSLLIMTIVGGAVAPVIMGYIADTTGSMAIAFLIPLVCYGVIGGYAFSNRSGSSLAKK
jgi:hypothetical protein